MLNSNVCIITCCQKRFRKFYPKGKEINRKNQITHEGKNWIFFSYIFHIFFSQTCSNLIFLHEGHVADTPQQHLPSKLNIFNKAFNERASGTKGGLRRFVVINHHHSLMINQNFFSYH